MSTKLILTGNNEWNKNIREKAERKRKLLAVQRISISFVYFLLAKLNVYILTILWYWTDFIEHGSIVLIFFVYIKLILIYSMKIQYENNKIEANAKAKLFDV